MTTTKEKEMKLSKILGVAAVAALALMAFASTVSATTLEVGGVTKNEPVFITASLEPETTADLTDTSGFFANRCSISHVEGTTTTPFSATRIGGPIKVLTFESCTEDAKEKVKVDLPGYLTVEAIAGTTNGTVFSDSAEVTSPSPFGKLNCKTAATGTHIGKLTGKKSTAEHATMDIEAVLNCGAITAKWKGSYIITTPTGLGVE
jgi:hypothetical protein